MTRGEKILAVLMILIIVGIAVLYWRQSQDRKERQRMEERWGRNPFLAPGNSTNAAPAK